MDLYDDVFSPESPLAKSQSGYKFRESQFEMAMLIDEALDEKKHAVIEAGTGTGKSFAYLAPIVMHLMRDRSKKAVIATSTITLEKQLYEKDIPVILKALNADLNVSILYGKKNYLCLRKYRESFGIRPSLIDADGYKKFDEWVRKEPYPTRSDVPSKDIYQKLVPLLLDEADCSGRHCSLFDECYFYKARRKALSSDLVVTNHHLMLLDAKNRMENETPYDEDAVLPGYSYGVIDEAHHIESEATEALSEKYNCRALVETLNDLMKKQKRFGSLSAIEALAMYEKPDKRNFFKRVKGEISEIKDRAEAYDRLITPIISSCPGRDEVLFDSEFYNRFRNQLLEGELLADEIATLAFEINDEYIEEAKESPAYDYIMKAVCSLSSASDTLRSFIRFNDFKEKICFASIIESDHYEIKIAPMTIGPILSRVLLSHLDTLIYSSATLSVNNDFKYFEARSGLKEESDRVLRGIYKSPFDYGRSLMFLLPQDGKGYANDRAPEYIEYVQDAIESAIKASGGGALVLFTSRMMLEEVYKRAKEDLSDYELLVQDGKTSKNALLNRFRNSRDSSLFATSSFWEGVDVPGDTLRLLIIVKLPFETPSAPILRARVDNMKSDGDNPFMSIYLPETTIKLKQGIGRLIRSENDKGVVLILDNRILSKSYGRVMIASLPEGYIPEDTVLENIPDKIERFLY